MGNEIIEGVETVVNTLSKAWDIVEEMEPKADIASNSCNAVPDIKDWTDLHEGGHAATASRNIKVLGILGDTYIDVLYHLSYTYGATYKGGGAYIPSCVVSIERCEVAMLYSVSVKLAVLETSNVGTHHAPVAHLKVQLSDQWSNHFAKVARTKIYNLYGDGRTPVEE